MPFWFLLATFAILGAIWGSFVAALCNRWPKGESIIAGRSACDGCGKTIAAYDLVPIVSYLALRGRCRHCGQPIGAQITGVEIASASTGLISVLILPPAQALAASLFGWLLLPLAILDHRHYWLPDRLILLLGAAGLIAGPMLKPELAWTDRAVGAAAGFLTLEAIRLLYKRHRERDGMGVGDPKLFAAIGIWVGWQNLPLVLLLAAMIGLSCAVARRLSTTEQDAVLPLGTYLAVASLLLCWAGTLPLVLRSG